MAWAALAPILKEIGLGVAITGGFTLAGKGISWLWSRAAAKWAARRGAQAAAQAVAGLEARNLIQQALVNMEQRFKELRELAEAARAAGNMTLARSYDRQLTQLVAEYTRLSEVAQIGREKWYDRAAALLGTAAMVGFTVEEWRQSTMFRENLRIQGEMQARKEEIERAKMAQFAQYIQTLQQKMMADEQNRAFWAWYLQQKANLEAMRQQAYGMKRAVAGVRRSAGRQTSHVGDKILLEQVKAYYRALDNAYRRQREWERFWQSVNLENLKAMNEQQAIAMRAKWDAWLESVKAAYNIQEELTKMIRELTTQYQEAALKSQLQREEFALKAKLEEWETMLAEHKMRLAHTLEMEKIEISEQLRRTTEAIRGVYDAINNYMKSLLEIEKIDNAKEVVKEGKNARSEASRKVSAKTRRLLEEYGDELLRQLKLAGKLSLEPRRIERKVLVYSPESALSHIYRR
jgi:hypothetical protein